MTVRRRAAVALAAICLCLGTGGGAASAKTKKHHHHTHRPHGQHAPAGAAAEGRAHLKRANALAGEGDCAAAIEEYTKAYEQLDDPVVLFNRGECYRRTGDGENAVDDYREFLDKVPNAPNRADIETKIVALEAPEPSSSKQPAAPPKQPAAASKEPAAAQPAPSTAKAAEGPATPPPSAPVPESKPAPAVAVGSPAPVEDSGPGAGSRPWVWITLAVLVAGAAAGGYLVFRPHQDPPPATALGNYRF